MRAWRIGLLIFVPGVFLGACEGCMRRVPVEQVELGEWPACALESPDEMLVRRELRSGPNMLEKSVVERYSIARHGECFVGRMLLRWKLGDTALEVVWDRDMVPLAAYKRMSFPGDESLFDERAYRMSEEGTGMVRVAPGEVETFELRGARPTVVVPTGRGLFSMAFQRGLELPVGASNTETVVDLRRLVERIERGAVRHDPSRDHEWTDAPLTTYTFMGRDTFFLDEEGYVMGDMAGIEASDAEVGEVFEGLEPPVDVAEAWARLRVAGRR